MTIKEVLKEAGRYEDILDILDKIIKNMSSEESLPVHPYRDIESFETLWKVNSLSVRCEAESLLELIDSGDIRLEKEKTVDDFYNLFQYVSSHSDILLHNYAVAISHRSEPSIDMEKIRCWEILDNLIICLGPHVDEPNFRRWDIPVGWKKQ